MVSSRASAYTARRPESAHSRRPARAPYSEAPIPYAHATSARIRHARPRMGIEPSGLRLVGRELRRALRDERVVLAHEDAALLPHGDDDLAVLAEGVGHRSGVADGHGRAAGAIAHAEVEDLALVRVAGDDLARQLVGASRGGARQQLAGALGR